MELKSLSYSTARVIKFTNALGESLPNLQSLKSLPKKQLLKAIDEPSDFLVDLENDYEELAVLISALEISGDEILDPYNVATNCLEAAESRLKPFLRALERCHKAAALADTAVKEDQSENVVTNYKKAIYSTQLLISAVHDKRWEILSHDAPQNEIAKFHSDQQA